MANAISPKYLDTDFPLPLTLDDKIEIFADRVRGWQLDIAKQCADNIPHSGFAVLSIVCNYFEMIAKFKDGYTGESKPRIYFQKGFDDFLSVFPTVEPDLREKLIDRMWKGVRCALYHTGITKGTNLSGDYLVSIEFVEPTGKVHINPHRLVPDLEKHFEWYVKQLRDSNNQDLRKKFEVRFDYR